MSFDGMSFQLLEKLCKVIAHASSGLSKRELIKFLELNNIEVLADGSSKSPYTYKLGLSKKDWLYRCLVNEVQANNSFNVVFSFIKSVVNPALYTSFNKREQYQYLIEEINKILLFIGVSVDQTGLLIKVAKAQTLSEVDRRVNFSQKTLYERAIHSEVRKYCGADYSREDYFDAVFEAAKGLAERVRQITGLTTDGGKLFQTAFSTNDPYIFFNELKTENEKNEFIGLKELLEAIFHLARNPRAHTPKINWYTDEKQALDMLCLISVAHRYLDHCYRVPRK